MFGLIRRISHSVIPRPDRPWEDDPTSNAPHKGRKRRLSSTERDTDPAMEQSNKKKVRGDSTTPSVTDVNGVVPDSTSTPSQAETQALKEVTQGVKEVDLEETAPPENIPLPEGESDELDEPSSNSTPPPEASSPQETPTDEETHVDELSSPVEESTAAGDSPPLEKVKVKEGETVLEVVAGENSTPDLDDLPQVRRKLRSQANNETSAKD